MADGHKNGKNDFHGMEFNYPMATSGNLRWRIDYMIIFVLCYELDN